jgi:hypothetical protein
MGLFERVETRRELSGQLIWFGLWFAVTAVALLLTPDANGHGTHKQLGLPACPSVLMFDRPCPGCGMTTSWAALVQGNFELAIRAHAMGPFLYGVFALSGIACGIGWWTKTRITTETKLFNRGMAVVMASFVIFGAARMVIVSDFGTESEKLFSRIGRGIRP